MIKKILSSIFSDVASDIKDLIHYMVAIKTPVLLSVLFFTGTQAVDFVEKYIYNDWGYLVILSIAVLLDAYFAIYTNWANFEIGIFFKKTFKKLSVYGAGLLIGHGLMYLGLEYLKQGLYWLIYIVEADSIAKKAAGKSLIELIKIIVRYRKKFDSLNK